VDTLRNFLMMPPEIASLFEQLPAELNREGWT